MHYDVKIARVSTRTSVFEVEADNARDAQMKALEMAFEYDFSEESERAPEFPVIDCYEYPPEILVDRTHEECCDCVLQTIRPAQCKGHAEGPIACPDFQSGPPPMVD